jgi:hypothetical protein
MCSLKKKQKQNKMYQVLKEKEHTAQKEYDCDASEWLNCEDFMTDPKDYGVTFADMRRLVKIRQEGFKILKGTRYIYQVFIFEGKFYTARARIDVAEICKKYELSVE